MSSATRSKTVLILGAGGREHALAEAMARSPEVGRVVISPGHALFDTPATRPGGATIERARPPAELGLTPEGWLHLAEEIDADLTLVGPEAPLGMGVVDEFEAHGRRIFGPQRAAAEIETSKAFSKTLMERAGVRTPRASIVRTVVDAARALEHFPEQVVVKAAGLASGKGVYICQNHAEALGHTWRLIEDEELGPGGTEVLIETVAHGHEASVMAICDYESCVLLPAVRDFKRRHDGDRGPNTGGMGAFCPVPGYGPETLAHLERTVFTPILRELRDAGRPFKGVLFAGLIRDGDAFQVLEFNARFGDPETQALLPLIESDLFALLEAAAAQRLAAFLETTPLRVSGDSAVAVVLAAPGYPKATELGQPIPAATLEAAARAEGVEVFSAQLKRGGDGALVNGGGRTLTIVGKGSTVPAAQERAYAFLEAHAAPPFVYRSDIAAFADRGARTYAAAGVHTADTNQTLAGLESAITSTWSEAVLSPFGGFAGLYDLSAVKALEAPVLVASTDGIGTKSMLARALGRWDGLGHDLVHHGLNDIATAGARPLFFLDLIASARFDQAVLAEVIAGVSAACRAHGVSLIGGETAEMPGVYRAGELELAGTVVGVVERSRIIDGARISAGDQVLGLPSSGLHTNGYALVRQIFFDGDLQSPLEGTTQTLGEALLAPHRCYLPELDRLETAGLHPRGLIHITGGAYRDNPERVLPKGLGLSLSPWPLPPLFEAIRQRGRIDLDEMRATFNLGFGLLLILPPDEANRARALLPELALLGRVIARDPNAPAVRWEPAA